MASHLNGTQAAHTVVYSTMISPVGGDTSHTAKSQQLSMNGQHIIIPEQGRAGMTTSGPINLDCWAQYRDRDEDVEIFFAVYNPTIPTIPLREWHWSLAWEIGGTTSWRQIHIVQENDPRGPPPQPRYVYWGALTKSAGPTDAVATRFSLGVFSLAARREIEELAKETPVMVPDGTWNCQDWLQDLMQRVVSAGIVRKDRWDSVWIAVQSALSKKQ